MEPVVYQHSNADKKFTLFQSYTRTVTFIAWIICTLFMISLVLIVQALTLGKVRYEGREIGWFLYETIFLVDLRNEVEKDGGSLIY